MGGRYGLPKRQGALRARTEMMFAGYSMVPVKQGRIGLADRSDPLGPLREKRKGPWQRHTDEDDKYNVQEDEDFEDEDDDFDDDLDEDDEDDEDFGDDFDEDDDDLDDDF